MRAVDNDPHKPWHKTDDKFQGQFHARYESANSQFVDRTELFWTGW